MENVVNYDIIRSPIITEKSTVSYSQNKFTCKVAKSAKKHSVKRAVANIFAVEVVKVNMMNVPGYSKYFRGRKGHVKGFKKAVVTLRDDNMLKKIVGE